MSQYPYGYPFKGQPPQQPQQPYTSQPYGAYPPANGYGAQQPPQPQAYPPTTGNYYASSQSAYDYNAHSIPGLGTPSAMLPVPMPFTGSWNQGGNPTPPFPGQFFSYSSSNPTPPVPLAYSAPVAHAPAQAEAPAPQKTQPAMPIERNDPAEQSKREPKAQSKEQAKIQPKAQVGDAESQDEGEISDSYFDDLYDDVPNQPSGAQEPTAPNAGAAEGADGDGSDQEPNFYDTDMDDAPAPENKSTQDSEIRRRGTDKPLQETERERTRSYSPHLSPAEIQPNTSSLQESAPSTEVAMRGKLPQGPDTRQGASSAAAQGASVPVNSEGDSNGSAVIQSAGGAAAPPRSFTSIPEADNAAKKAILSLLPYGVKFQTYIDEGFDRTYVKDMFTQLNLPCDPDTSKASPKPVSTPAKENPASSNQISQPTAEDAMAKKQEERKDRIRRLLAEKKAKAADASSNAGAAAESKDVPAPSVAGPSKVPTTTAEKNRLLQHKMALIKALAAQKTGQKQEPSVAQNAIAPKLRSASSQSPARPSSASGNPARLQDAVSTLATPQRPSTAAPSPSVPAFPSAPQGAQQVNQRKRPTAADFMDYPTPSFKRPSLANRQDSSLVISISDEEDDDEDVEMEVDSAPEDSPAPKQQTLTIPRRGPAIRDYPPLTNIASARHMSSSVSGMAGKTANGLEEKEKAIEALRRKIEEAEARAKSRPARGSATPQTPSAGGNTPIDQVTRLPMSRAVSSSDTDDKNGPPAHLPQENHNVAATKPLPELTVADRESDKQRHISVSSASLSAKSAKALEKAERLKRLQEEMLKLQAEMDEDSDEDQGASEEVEAGSTHVNDLGQPVLDLAPSEITQQSQAMDIDTPEIAENKAKVFADAFLASIDTSISPSHTGGLNVTDSAGQPTQALVETAGSPDNKEEPAVADANASDDYEPPEARVVDPAVGSRSLDPAGAELADESEMLARSRQQQTDSSQHTRISGITTSDHDPYIEKQGQPMEITREVQVLYSSPTDRRLTSVKAPDAPIQPPSQTSFVPYESPLRYFHAYRFHPEYLDGVTGGLKSLTYSNRIDPNKEMCPDEWEGNDCPRGEACQFQHFQSIVAPDNKIILELGSSDEFSGEQKKNFNNGLRKVVADFQQSKVRDFRTIAQAIVDFRRQFLGDSSKILPLEGVSI